MNTELIMEEAQERREEAMYIWIDECHSMLEEEFIKTFPQEDRPLDDDDISNFMDNHLDDFIGFAKDKYMEGH